MDLEKEKKLTFAPQLQELRRSRGLTRAQLTNSIGEKLETVSGWERGKEAPGVVTIVKLSDALQVSINYLSNNCFIQI